MEKQAVAIVGVGSWLPRQVRANDAWPATFGVREHAVGDRTFNDIPASRDPLSAAILARDFAAEASDACLGARLRHVADDATSAVDAESSAACAALDDA